MPYEGELGEATTLSIGDAFAALGSETRLQILQSLGEATDPVPFSKLRERVGIQDSGQFNYHLDKLEGHFVRKTDDGYDLRRAGSRVIEAILSGAVTDAPVLDWTRVDQSCPFCGAAIRIRYHQETVEMFCLECPGTWGTEDSAYRGYLGQLSLPPAGLRNRSTDEMCRAAWTWQHLKILAIAEGMCPSCSAAIDRRTSVCDAHDASEGLCGECERRHAIQFHVDCTNCIFDGAGTFSLCLAANTELLAFLTAHDINPIAPSTISTSLRATDDYEEVVRSTDPFEAQLTFAVDGDSLTLTVDDELSVVDVRRSRNPKPSK